MKFGLFDHLERSPDRALATQFDERLEFVAAADEAGFYCLHVAEHHSSRLNMVPAPGVWLSAVARATRRWARACATCTRETCTTQPGSPPTAPGAAPW